MAFVLTSTVRFNIWKLSNLQRTLCTSVVRNMGQFTYFKCKVASLSWFAHFGMRICEGAQLSCCSHLVDHTSILVILQVNSIRQRSFLGHKTCHFLLNPFNCYDLKIQRMIHAHVLLSKELICHVSRSYGEIPFQPQNLSMKIPPPTLSERQLKQPFHRLGDLKVKLRDISTSMSKSFVGIKCEGEGKQRPRQQSRHRKEGPPLPSLSKSMLRN